LVHGEERKREIEFQEEGKLMEGFNCSN